uniref:Uncharacterized protein n=1 Tax=Arundo donax TaxID=35708 RepID=A0A0A9EV66_ARUDO
MLSIHINRGYLDPLQHVVSLRRLCSQFAIFG